jgi:hypothetical protein
MNVEAALIQALALCEQADTGVPAERVVAIVAKQFNVDSGQLLDLWFRKWAAVLDAKDAIARERTGEA